MYHNHEKSDPDISLQSQSDELIGEVLLENGRLSVRDFFSEDAIFPLHKQLNITNPEIGSIIHGLVDNKQVQCLAILATPESVHRDLYTIASKHSLNPLFPDDVMKEVDEILANPGLAESSLVDMEHLAFCTIDGAGTRDLDQALYIETSECHNEQSNYKVYYALADASYYVRPGTSLFNEALNRGASYYLPGLMIPMLPRALCEGLISLNENVIRRAMVFELELDSSGFCINTHIFRARIKSRAKLSFDKVQMFLERGDAALIGDTALEKSLQLLKTVGELRLKLADERSIVRYRRHEMNVKLGPDGCRYTILDRLRNDVEQYNEQLSLLCNVEGARFLSKEDTNDDHIQPIYRVHPSPPQSAVSAFESLLESLIELHQLDPGLWHWCQNGRQTLADYLKNLPETGPLSRIAQAIHRQAIMINVRSSFSDEAARHYGVGADVYARFSAPMREIVGVFLHKEVVEKRLETSPDLSKNEDDELRDTIIKVSNQSKTLQRKVTHEGNRLVLNQLFQDDLQDTGTPIPIHKGTVMGIEKQKLYVLLDYPKIEVKVYISYLESMLNTKLRLDDEKVTLYQHDQVYVRLGDMVSLYVKEKDPVHDRWVLLLDQET